VKRIRVLLVEDHQVVREGLRSLLEKEGDIEVLGDTDSGEMACQMARELRPDVVLMDLVLSGMNGLQATESIKAELPSVRILALTMHGSEEYVYGMLRGGADGYLLKYSAARELAAAIRTVYRGESMLSPTIAKKLIDDIRGKTGHAYHEGPLSGREKEILVLTAKGYTSREIGDILFLSPKTVDNHRARIMDKLQAKNQVEAVMNAVAAGIISPSQAQATAEGATKPESDYGPKRRMV